MFIFALLFSCQARQGAKTELQQSIIPADRLTAFKNALPRAVAYPMLDQVLKSEDTFWYDHKSLPPAYQGAIAQSPPWGANSNDRWFELIADSVQKTARVFYDTDKRRFKFPFGTTAGTDNSTNIVIANFLHLPKNNGRKLPVAIKKLNTRFDNGSWTSNAWGWVYPKGAIVGEILFIQSDDGRLLPSEIRTRTRYASEWAVNVYRPFPTAESLAQRIVQLRPQWQNDPNLSALISHLQNPNSLTPLTREAVGMPGVFKESGYIDVLPAINDSALVTELLTTTPFISAYDLAWKKSGDAVSFAPSVSAGTSIVPTHYEAGIIAVNEQSCARCHSETARHISNFHPSYRDIVLYGEMWGRDAIFSFHPFDPAAFNSFWNENTRDNRRLHPELQKLGLVEFFNSNTHTNALYPEREVGGVGRR